MDIDQKNSLLRELIQSASNMQEFADLASPEDNWDQMDKNITLPREIGFAVEECPSCFDDIRLIYDKFTGSDIEVPLTCPHCKAELTCVSEYTGYTNEIILEE